MGDGKAFPALHKDGHEFHVTIHLSAISHAGHDYIVATLSESANLKTTLESLTHLTETLQIATESAGIGVWHYNAKTDEYTQMLAAGIIDPTKVTRIALENAASVAGMILTTACTLVDIKEDTPAPAMPPMGGGMPGMM